MDLKKYLRTSGWLPVGNGHQIYWEDWGNPKSETPIFYLHGGPGGAISDKSKLPFDPLRQRVIFHDQRGCGQSTPFGSTRHNTTQDLIADINKLRISLKIDRLSLCGGSWGSTLALCYAIANPRVVDKMLLRGIYLGRKSDNDYIYYEIGSHFPDVHERFMSLVPRAERHNVIKYYDQKFDHPDPAVRAKYVKEWVLYENSLMSLDGNLDKQQLDAADSDDKDLTLAKIETHYFAKQCFLPDNYILKKAAKIKHIPTVIVHGRYDFVCPPRGAFELKAALGKNARLHVVPGGHSASEATKREVMKAYINVFL